MALFPVRQAVALRAQFWTENENFAFHASLNRYRRERQLGSLARAEYPISGIAPVGGRGWRA